MISEFAPIILYLRHRVDQGDVLIIEEPEAHLHPSMQITLTRQLAALVNAGVRIIVTTHSTWMLKELANLIRLSSQSNSSRGGDHASLTAEEVGVWMFQAEKSSEGSTATQIDLDESGMYAQILTMRPLQLGKTIDD